MDYVLVIHRAEEGGYWAEVPVLEGCFAQGESIEDLLEDARQSIAAHLDALREDSRPLPEGSGILIATVRVPEPKAA